MTRVDMFYLILVVIVAIACLFWKLSPNFFVKRLNKKVFIVSIILFSIILIVVTCALKIEFRKSLWSY